VSTDHLGKLYRDGEVVVRQGEIGDCMFAILRGRVEVVRETDGGEVRIAVMEEGQIFGEMAIFERELRSATVRALGEARLLTIDKRTFLGRVQEDPSLAFNLVRMMCSRIRKLSAELAALKPASALHARDQAARGVDGTDPGKPPATGEG
jgi:CRP-like cAMP-binding protein